MFQPFELFSEVGTKRVESTDIASDTWKGCLCSCPPNSVSQRVVWPSPARLSSRPCMMLPPCCCSGVVFLIIERDIKRFMVYSYRRCSGRRSVEIDTAITARLITGCDSHMLGETKVEVAGGVPPAGWPRAHLQARDGVLGSIPEPGTGCWAGTQHPPAPSPSEAHKELAIGLAVLQSTNIKRKKKQF